MAHHRHRSLHPLLLTALKFSPLVGVLGHRQVGKTTLLSQIGKAYFALDDEESVANQIDTAPEFLREVAGPKPVAIDEAQLMPSLFPALKEWVRKHKAPGQFLLSGSIRFTSKKSIQESLTGRIVNYELLPLTINELLEVDAPELLPKAHLSLDLEIFLKSFPVEKTEIKRRLKALKDYEIFGGLPGICFVRNEKIRIGRIASQIDTLLDRDLRMLCTTQLGLMELKEILSKLADSSGQEVKLSELSTRKRMNSTSLNKILDALEALFIIRRIPIVGYKRGSVVFFEDIAEQKAIQITENDLKKTQLQMLFSIVRAAFAYREGEFPSFAQFQTRGGSMVPICVRSKEGVSGFIPIADVKPSRSERASAKSFFAAFRNAKVFYVYNGMVDCESIDDRQCVLSLAHLTL